MTKSKAEMILRKNPKDTILGTVKRNNVASAHVKRWLGPHEARPRAAGEATPNGINVWELPTWTPHSMEPARSGASDHLKHKSAGIG